MAKQELERRKYDEEILIAIAEIKKDTEQIFNRLDKINGTVQDYTANKYKMDLSCTELLELRKNHITHIETDHRNMDEKYIGRKLFTTLSVILGLLIVVTNVLQYFKF